MEVRITFPFPYLHSFTPLSLAAGSESGFGDVAGDGGDGNISDFAAVCLDSLSQAIDPMETVRVCMTYAWGLVSQVRVRVRVRVGLGSGLDVGSGLGSEVGSVFR